QHGRGGRAPPGPLKLDRSQPDTSSGTGAGGYMAKRARVWLAAVAAACLLAGGAVAVVGRTSGPRPPTLTQPDTSVFDDGLNHWVVTASDAPPQPTTGVAPAAPQVRTLPTEADGSVAPATLAALPAGSVLVRNGNAVQAVAPAGMHPAAPPPVVATATTAPDARSAALAAVPGVKRATH